MTSRPGVARCLFWFLLVMAASQMAPLSANPGNVSAVVSLGNALQRLREQGLNIVFSNALVKPSYRVDELPDTTLPLAEQAGFLLTPFGLELRKVEPDTYYVVAKGELSSTLPDSPPQIESEPVIEQIVVTSSRYRLVRNLHERDRLGQQELQAIPSLGRDLLRAVNQLPGQASSGVSARNHIRGGNTDEVLYMVDDVELIEPFHLRDFQALFSAVNPWLVDSVDVYSGGFPVTFGNRLAGVVDLEVKPATDDLSGAVDVNLISASAYVQGGLGNVEWLASGRRSVVDLVMGGLKNDYGDPQFDDEMVRVAWEGTRASVVVGALTSNDEISLEEASAGEEASADYHNFAGWMLADITLHDRAELRLSLSHTGVSNEREGILNDPLDAVGALEESRKFRVLTAKSSLRWAVDDSWLVNAGVEGQYQKGEFDVMLLTRYGPLGTPLQPQSGLQRFVAAERDGTVLTGFVSLQHQVSDRLALEYGLRYDLQDMDPVHDGRLSPRLQANFRLGPSLALFVNLGRYTQHQNLYELQLDDGLLELNAPQVADQFSFGADWRPASSTDLRLEAYLRTVEHPRARFENLYNPWVLLPELHADRVGLMPDEARARGIEVSLRHQLGESLSTTLVYAYARTEESLGGHWRPRPWDQRHAGRFGIEWRPGSWRVSASAFWHSGWPNTPRLADPPASSRSLYTRRLPNYFSLDLNVGRHWTFARGELDLYLDLSNATMRNNVGGYRYEVEDGRVVRDPRTLLPAIPALGVTWTW